jgi:flagellar protein FliT
MIMSVVHEVFNLSRDFLEELSKPSQKNERDNVILKINEFLAKREIFLKEMKGPYNYEEQRMGKEMIELEKKLHEIFATVKLEIQQDFLAAKNKKKHTPKYINPYTNVFNEGAYYDKRN